MYIDSHAHLFGKEFHTDVDETIRRAVDAGVEAIIVPGTDEATSREAIELAEKYDGVYACVGIHPHESSKSSDDGIDEIEKLSRHRKVVAIGEIGLDYHYDFSPRQVQMLRFRDQVQLAVDRNLPIVVHTRESLDDTMRIVQEMTHRHPKWKPSGDNASSNTALARGVFHCFTGSAEEAGVLFELGFFVSYPGIVTFKNSPVVPVLEQIGFQNILLETDSPYMTPEPFRGKRNEPANIVHICSRIAEIMRVSEDEVARVTSLNSRILFNLGSAGR